MMMPANNTACIVRLFSVHGCFMVYFFVRTGDRANGARLRVCGQDRFCGFIEILETLRRKMQTRLFGVDAYYVCLRVLVHVALRFSKMKITRIQTRYSLPHAIEPF